MMAFITIKNYTQQSSVTLKFEPVKATLSVYVINESDENKIKAIIRNINNALEDPRLKGKLKVELLTFGAGVEMYKKVNAYEPLLLALQNKGVVMVQCENTLNEKKFQRTSFLIL